MFKISVKSSDNQLGIGPGYIVSGNTFDYLIGRLLTLIEAIGLKETQEKSLKDLIRQEVWGSVRDHNYVESDLLTSVNLLIEKIKREGTKRSILPEGSDSDSPCPVSDIKGEYEVSFTEKE